MLTDSGVPLPVASFDGQGTLESALFTIEK